MEDRLLCVRLKQMGTLDTFVLRKKCARYSGIEYFCWLNTFVKSYVYDKDTMGAREYPPMVPCTPGGGCVGVCACVRVRAGPGERLDTVTR